MKFRLYSLLGALLLSASLSAAVDPATFDKVIDLYKKQEATRKDLINAYDQLDNKRLGDQLLQAFLKTNIRKLRLEEARKEPEYGAIPAPVDRGRPECSGPGCRARRRIQRATPATSRPTRTSRRQEVRRQLVQEQKDLELAKKRSIQTAIAEQEKEDIETAKALSLVEQQEREAAENVAQVQAFIQEEKNLEEAIKRSRQRASQQKSRAERDRDILQETLKQAGAERPAAQPKVPKEKPSQATGSTTAEQAKTRAERDADILRETMEFMQPGRQQAPESRQEAAEPSQEQESPQQERPAPRQAPERPTAEPREIPGVWVELFSDGTPEFNTYKDQYSHKDEPFLFDKLLKERKSVVAQWGRQLSKKLKTDKARWTALAPLIESYQKDSAPKQELSLLMRDTLLAVQDKRCPAYQSLPGQLQ